MAFRLPPAHKHPCSGGTLCSRLDTPRRIYPRCCSTGPLPCKFHYRQSTTLGHILNKLDLSTRRKDYREQEWKDRDLLCIYYFTQLNTLYNIISILRCLSIVCRNHPPDSTHYWGQNTSWLSTRYIRHLPTCGTLCLWMSPDWRPHILHYWVHSLGSIPRTSQLIYWTVCIQAWPHSISLFC